MLRPSPATAFATALLAIALVNACARPAAQQQAPAFDPSGTYDFTADVEGSPVAGVLTIRRTNDGYSASISTDLTGVVEFQPSQPVGRRLELRADVPDGTLTMQLTFDGPAFAGNWQLTPGPAGTISGTRRDS